jgi:formyltetrahydrofolate deformylase
MKAEAQRFCWLISCPDQPGVVAAVAGFLLAHGGNILTLDEHVTSGFPSQLYMRIAFSVSTEAGLPADFEAKFADQVAKRLGLKWRLTASNVPKKVSIWVSAHDHALLELLWRWSSGELPMTINNVISNHQDLKPLVESWGLSFIHVVNTPAIKTQAEAAMLAAVADVELIILARYMQILSPAIIERFPHRIINIHHSFLPAFRGANPYQQAFDLGVKLIGATAHYVTEQLDVGPIIAQDTRHVGHRDQVADLRQKGKVLERSVLAQAVAYHLQDRIVVDGHRTIVFE